MTTETTSPARMFPSLASTSTTDSVDPRRECATSNPAKSSSQHTVCPPCSFYCISVFSSPSPHRWDLKFRVRATAEAFDVPILHSHRLVPFILSFFPEKRTCYTVYPELGAGLWLLSGVLGPRKFHQDSLPPGTKTRNVSTGRHSFML